MISSISIYPNSLQYIFGKNHDGIDLNLGGFYNSNVEYDFSNEGFRYRIYKEQNNLFIQKLFGKIELISAIVGKNGTGKTTLLKNIKNGDLIAIDNNGIKVSTLDYLKIYYTPFLSYDDEHNEGENVINISKFSQFRKELRHDSVGISELLEIHNSEFLKNLIKLKINSSVYEKLLQLGLPEISFLKVKILKLKEDDWNISRNFVSYLDELNLIRDEERINKEQKVIESLDLKNAEEIRLNKEYLAKSYKIRLEIEIINSIILKIKQILEHSGNKYLEEGFVDGEIYKLKEIKSYKEGFYWFIERAYIKPTKNSKPILLPINEIKDFTDSLVSIIEQQKNYSNWTEFYVSDEFAKEFIEKYQKLIFSFRKYFTFDDYPILQFSTDIQLSTGEKSMYEIFSQLNEVAFNISNDIYLDYAKKNKYAKIENYIILLDEADIGFHPTWKKKFVNLLVEITPLIFTDKNLQIIFTTHDPLTLSDIPNNNIVFLDKSKDGKTFISSKNDKSTFGANISDLLADSFFIEDGLMGDFAKNKIEEIILWINENKENKRRNEEFYSELNFYKKIIEIIDERILKVKLSEMISELEGDNSFQKEILKKEIDLLNKKFDEL